MEFTRYQRNNSRRLKPIVRFSVFLCFTWICLGQGVQADPYTVVNKVWDRFGSVYRHIVGDYYLEIDHEEMMQAAIEGMLRKLDSFSQFFDREGLRQLRQDTSGKFAGLGITIGIKDLFPVVIAPIDGTPASRAGLVPGDLIKEVDGRSMQGMPLDEVVELLRGDPGTIVRLKVIHKAGLPVTKEIEIVREIIKLKTVLLVEELESGIGYISMRQTRFSEETAVEVEQALEELIKIGVRGLILDLRANPGGLLGQATQVADLFLDKGAPIVSVKERHGQRADIRYALRNQSAGNLPLVVLLDAGSASASEIVAGAIQDNDRGIVVGTTSYGKGSVQTIFNLHEVDSSALKLTTALYYTPSGRSIHRDDHVSLCGWSFYLPIGQRNLPGVNVLDIVLKSSNRSQVAARMRSRFDLEASEIDQILATSLDDLVGFSLTNDIPGSSPKQDDDKLFLTQRGRKVYGGGGIAPDIYVQEDKLPQYIRDIEQRRLFFDFIVDYVGADTTQFKNYPEEALESRMLAAFRIFLDGHDVHAGKLESVRIEVDRMRVLLEDMGWEEPLSGKLDTLTAEIERTSRVGFTSKIEPYILRGLRRELALRLSGRRAQLLAELEQDQQLNTAIEVLLDEQRYHQLLVKGPS